MADTSRLPLSSSTCSHVLDTLCPEDSAMSRRAVGHSQSEMSLSFGILPVAQIVENLPAARRPGFELVQEIP